MLSPRLRAVPVLSLALVAGALILAFRAGSPVPRPPRHVILISLDTLRADHLGAWGYDRETSPRLDALARRSVVFRRAVAQGSSTIPSHASLFTSQYASAVTGGLGGLQSWPETLAEALGRAGFATWGFVDGGNVRARFGFARGFDHYEDDRIGARRLFARARQWLLAHRVPRFFLFLHTYEIHTPYSAPPEYVELFGDPEYGNGGFHPNTYYFRAAESRPEPHLSERERREVVARYDAGIRYTDEQLGDLLDWLDAQGLLADSLVVMVSDHGEEFLEHGRLGHQQLYLDPNLRVLLLFHRDGLAPRVIDETVELADVAPTILDLLGLPPLRGAVGRSLAPVLRGRRRPVGRVAYSEKGGASGHRTVITDRYQLLADRKSREVRLFDLVADPGATREISAEQPEVAAELAGELGARARAAGRVRRRHWHEEHSRPPPLSDKVRRELETLGYLER